MRYLVAILTLVATIAYGSSARVDEPERIEFGNKTQFEMNQKGELVLAYAENCYLDSERESGLTKICYYDCFCGTKALNIKSYELCPLSAKFSCY